MSRFRSWPSGSADAMERELLDLWKRERLFEQTLDANRNHEPFVFFEGPPTANGRPGIHHVFSRTIKDLICRFRAMQGRSITRIAGWDTHGLPVEIEVEKQLGLKGKKDIEAYGVEKFNALCRESVFKYKAEWESLSDRIGYWLDYEHPYVTFTNEYVESVWWLLRKLYEKGLLVRGHRVLPYCPRCGTVLSSHELSLGYEKVKDWSAYVAFQLEGSNRELVVWTTTPWTLPSNVALAVNPELEYHHVVEDATGREFIAAGDVTRWHAQEGLTVQAPIRGRELVGLRYRRPLDVVPLPPGKEHSIVIAGDFVSADEGSGIVHMAPAFGADDYAAGQKYNLALVRPVAADGNFSGTTWPAIEGRLVTDKDTNQAIVDRLRQDGRLLRVGRDHEHDYPFCWRCASKLIYYARDSWFVKTSAVKQRMLEINRDVHWHPPEVGAGRFGEWLENNVDWALSRDRYWGTPLPVWVCDRDAGHVQVIGSYDQLAGHWGKPLPAGFDPHKPFIDGYTWPCECGGTMARAAEVIDTWFDSGSMPYAQWHYPFEHEAEFKSHFPADYICEGVDQTRGWFYSLLAIATTVFDSPAYRNVIVNDLVLDAEGQKMSKSRGNVVDPWQVLGEFGADTIRLYFVSSSHVWLPKRFDPKAVAAGMGKFNKSLKNTYKFFADYVVDWEPGPRPGNLDRSDRWILDRLNQTIRVMTDSLENYDVTTGTKEVMRFLVDEVSNWYVRINRHRFWVEGTPDPAPLYTLHTVLCTLSRLLAPVAPFMTDWMHRQLAGTSVHLAGFPVPSSEPVDEALHPAMDAVRRLSSLARAVRDRKDVNLNVRQPLGRARVAVPAAVRGPLFDELLGLFRAEVNVKVVEIVATDTDLVRLRAKPNFRSLGKRYGKDTPKAAAAAARLSAEQLRALESGTPVELEADGTAYRYLPEDIVVEREVTTDWPVESDGPFVVALDTRLDDVLRREGLAREVVSRVQRLRKEANYHYADRIRLAIRGDTAVVQAAQAHAEFIKDETLARELILGTSLPASDLEQDTDIDGHQVTLAVRRYDNGRPTFGTSDQKWKRS